MKKFSFIIPVYNCDSYLISCIEKIQEIGLEQFEVILVNDGSSDNSEIICEKMSKEYETVNYVSQNNQGVSSARNHGLSRATGDYVIFLDADDTIEPKKLGQLLKILDTDDTIDMAIFGLTFDYYHKGILYRQDNFSLPFDGKVRKEQWIKKIYDLYDVNALSPIWNKVIKRSIIQKYDLKFCCDMHIYEDLDYSLRCMIYCNNLYFDPDIIYHYRQPEDEGNAGRRLKKIDHLSILVKRIGKTLEKLSENRYAKENQREIKTIELNLYLTIAREKISVSNIKGVLSVCTDFREWFARYDGLYLESERKYIMQLLNCKVYVLLLKRYYTFFRHKFAVWIKSMDLYQRRKRSG